MPCAKTRVRRCVPKTLIVPKLRRKKKVRKKKTTAKRRSAPSAPKKKVKAAKKPAKNGAGSKRKVTASRKKAKPESRLPEANRERLEKRVCAWFRREMLSRGIGSGDYTCVAEQQGKHYRLVAHNVRDLRSLTGPQLERLGDALYKSALEVGRRFQAQNANVHDYTPRFVSVRLGGTWKRAVEAQARSRSWYKGYLDAPNKGRFLRMGGLWA